ncbi:hypothetical protein LCGC14_1328200 [marine sediment metagenome]|uniref:Membrane transporter protein n=1 Tax=marine sediment metagenome TaxID=412755 RepID=A0A0F9NJU8_9ZZZZ
MTGLEGLSPHLSGPALLSVLIALGFVVGVLTGLFGVGGAFLLTPLLQVALGIPYPVAIGSSLSYTIGASSSAAARHWRLRNFEPGMVLILAGAAMVGAVLGGMANRSMEQGLGKTNYTLTMHGLFMVILALSAVLIGRGGRVSREGKSLLQRLPLPPRIDLPASQLMQVSIPGLCVVGLLVGVLKGMMGIGGGVLFMPLLILVVGLEAHQAVGTSLGVVLFSSIAGTVKYGLDGNVNMWIVMPLLISSVIGVQIGVWICQKLHAEKLRRHFAILVLLVTALLAWDFVRMLLRATSLAGV